MRQMVRLQRYSAAQLNYELSLIHRETLPYITKLRKSGFHEHVLRTLSTLNERFTDPSSREPVRSENFLSTSEQRLSSSLARYIVDHLWFGAMQDHPYGILNRLPLELMDATLSLTNESKKIFRVLLEEYESDKLADNAIPRYLTNIWKQSQTDFHRLRFFLVKLVDYANVKEFRMTDEQTANQIRALRNRFRVFPMEPLPDGIGVIRYCPNCKQWAWPVIDNDDIDETWKNCYSWGSQRLVYDLSDGKFYCDKQNTSVTSRKHVETVIEMENKHGKDGKLPPVVAKMIRRYKSTVDCAHVELIPVQMIGVLKQLNGSLWALCELCGSLGKFDKHHLDHRGFTCGVHDYHDFAKRAARLNKNKLDASAAALALLIPSNNKKRVPQCCLCLKEPKQRLVSIKVWDDKNFPRETAYRDIQVCQDCKNGADNIMTDQEIRTLTTLEVKIVNRRVKREMGLIY